MNNKAKLSILGAVVGFGVFASVSMDKYAQSTFREVSLINIEQQPYRSEVTARGSIYEAGGTWYAAVTADESDARFIREGQAAEVSGTGFGGRLNGVVKSIGSTAHTQLGKTVVDVTIEIASGITDDISELKSGYTAECSIFTDETKLIGTLPYEAIMQDDDGEYVYVFENSKAVRKNIRTGIELSGGAEITSGLSERAQVIAQPAGIRENELVRKEAEN